MTAKTYSGARVSVWVSKKSAARMACAWLWRKVVQGLAVALGCGLDPVALEDLAYRGGGDLDSQYGQFAVGASVAPVRVLPGQAQGEGLDAAVGGRPAGSFRSGCFGVVVAE
jgi:hypothetical protein